MLELVEGIRSLSRWARRDGEREPLTETIAALSLARQAVVLRTFARSPASARIRPAYGRGDERRVSAVRGGTDRTRPTSA